MTAPLIGLHDFYQPPAPAWTPQTLGWYVLFSLLSLLAIWFAIHWIRHWFANRYRREALRELPVTAPDQLSSLLKRVALAAWPRDQVASLSGDAWLRFLNETGEGDFRQVPGILIEEIALHPTALSSDDTAALRQVTAKWIRRHRVQA